MNFYEKNRKRIEIFWGKDKKRWDFKHIEKLFKKRMYTSLLIKIVLTLQSIKILIMTDTEPGGNSIMGRGF